MKSVNQVKRQESLKKWLEIIKDQRASGLSALAYCKREGIASTTFYYWQNQIQKLLIQQHEQQKKAKALPAIKPAFKNGCAVCSVVISIFNESSEFFGAPLRSCPAHCHRGHVIRASETDALRPAGCVPGMLIRELTADYIYLACGHTDMRKSIDGLAALVVSRFHLASHLTIELEHGPDVHGQREDPHRIEFIPAKVKVIDYYHESFQCLVCRKEALQAFLKSGNAALSNNICERAIRNFTIGRKNWLFSDSPKGAKASAAVYSIIENAKANGLNPFQYLKYLFEHLPNADIQRHPEHLDDVLPWNEIIQQNCK